MPQSEIRQLTSPQVVVFFIGSLLMVVGMGFYAFMYERFIASIVYLVGAIIFATLQCMQTYQGENLVVKRLKNIMNLADILFVLAGLLMVDTCEMFMRHVFTNVETYFQWFYNKWLVVLLIAVVLELYSLNRISHILKKDKEKEEEKK